MWLKLDTMISMEKIRLWANKNLSFVRRRSISNLLKKVPKLFLEDLKVIDSSSVVLDLGANVGHITELCARRGATVYAFEPNTQAFAVLFKFCRKYKNVKPFQVAAGVQNKVVKLFLHKDTDLMNEDLTQSSSLLSTKSNVDSDKSIVVFEVDLKLLIDTLMVIDILKIDIEGYEIEVINHLIESKCIEKIKRIYVETHELKNPELFESTMKLKQRVNDLSLSEKFVFSWH